VRISAAAASTTSSVRRFRKPSWSSLPYLPWISLASLALGGMLTGPRRSRAGRPCRGADRRSLGFCQPLLVGGRTRSESTSEGVKSVPSIRYIRA
jgi:hypothetical protein